MAKDTYYFSHDYNARNDYKILFLRQQLGMEAYGIYWYLIESLAESGGKLPLKIVPVLAMQMQVTEIKVTGVIHNFELFTCENEEFFSLRLNNHLSIRKLISEGGKKGAEKRWGNGGAIGDANKGGNTKERKGNKEKKEIKENQNIDKYKEERILKFSNYSDEIKTKLKKYKITEPVLFIDKSIPVIYYDLSEILVNAISDIEWQNDLVNRFGVLKFERSLIDFFLTIKANSEYTNYKGENDFKRHYTNWLNLKINNYR